MYILLMFETSTFNLYISVSNVYMLKVRKVYHKNYDLFNQQYKDKWF